MLPFGRLDTYETFLGPKLSNSFLNNRLRNLDGIEIH